MTVRDRRGKACVRSSTRSRNPTRDLLLRELLLLGLPLDLRRAPVGGRSVSRRDFAVHVLRSPATPAPGRAGTVDGAPAQVAPRTGGSIRKAQAHRRPHSFCRPRSPGGQTEGRSARLRRNSWMAASGTRGLGCVTTTRRPPTATSATMAARHVWSWGCAPDCQVVTRDGARCRSAMPPSRQRPSRGGAREARRTAPIARRRRSTATSS